MWSRKRLTAALVGAAPIALGLLTMGGGKGPAFGDRLPGLTADLQARFTAGKAGFQEVETVPDGIGPVFNDVSCVA
jgi:hypothetical protein